MSQALQNETAAFTGSKTSSIQLNPPELDPLATSGAPGWEAAVKARLTEIAGLEFNWDGRGSARVSPATMFFAWEMLSRMMSPRAPAPAIVPLGRGELQLSWHTSRGELEVEVARPNHVSIFYLDAAGVEHEWEESTNFHRLSDIVWNLHRS